MDDPRSPIYDSLFDQASEVLAEHQSCEVKNGKCLDGHFCCQNCKHLGPTGCTVQSLSCRVWLCYKAQAKHPEAAAKMREIRASAEAQGIPMFWRGSKEELLKKIPARPQFLAGG